jgi:hypothetical protein
MAHAMSEMWGVEVPGKNPRWRKRLWNLGMSFCSASKSWRISGLSRQQARCMVGRLRHDDIRCFPYPVEPAETVTPRPARAITDWQELKQMEHAHRIVEAALTEKDKKKEHKIRFDSSAKSKPRPRASAPPP